MTIEPFLSRRDPMTVAAALAAAARARSLMAKDQPTSLPEAAAGHETIKGIVYESLTGAPVRQAADPGLAGVLVSNGREVVRTGADGAYSFPAEDGTAIFVIKPTGYSVPLDETTRLPRFSYNQPDGIPLSLDLLYPGLGPSGPLPASVDFGLTKEVEPNRFDAVLFADPSRRAKPT
jgi:hypothetical protein